MGAMRVSAWEAGARHALSGSLGLATSPVPGEVGVRTSALAAEICAAAGGPPPPAPPPLRGRGETSAQSLVRRDDQIQRAAGDFRKSFRLVAGPRGAEKPRNARQPARRNDYPLPLSGEGLRSKAQGEGCPRPPRSLVRWTDPSRGVVLPYPSGVVIPRVWSEFAPAELTSPPQFVIFTPTLQESGGRRASHLSVPPLAGAMLPGPHCGSAPAFSPPEKVAGAFAVHGPEPSGPFLFPSETGVAAINEKLRVNRQIRISPVRVITPDGEQAGILPIERAMEIAEEMGLDLVEVAPLARPPVCRIMDYGKFKYEEQRQAREARKRQHHVQIKEVKMRPGIEDHDFDFKTRHARRFLEEGNKVKLTMMFRGRQMAHPEFGRQVLDRVSSMLQDISKVEQFPQMEGRSMVMVLAPTAKPA
ncbi:MAG TPA: translation initiation factor IF-3 [Longimicrobium sp.]